jgi:UDP-2,3-diacylglucosamine hydrolase
MPELPAIPVFKADPSWRRIDLLSDVHLHAGMPRTFAAWRAHLLDTPADAVLMLGDLFEVWVGDDGRHQGFEADCVAVLREAGRHRALAFMPGNRDFLVGDALLAEAGVARLADPTVLQAFGHRWLLSHGDALCLADTDYQQFRSQVRGSAWQTRFLGLPLSERQQQARTMRDASAAHQAGQGQSNWADVDDDAAADWLRQTGADTLIHGHTHQPAAHALPGGGTRQVLGDWEFDALPHRASLLRLSAAGLQRLDAAAPRADA